MMKLTKLTVSLSCVALGVGVGVVPLVNHADERQVQRVESRSKAKAPVTISSFHETYSSVTPADWATSSDHIAEVTVTGETRGAKEDGWVNRSVTVHVDRTRWSRPGVAELPSSFDMKTWGWVTTEDGLTEVSAPESSRIEPGHRYVMALILLKPRCDADDGLVVHGGWATIGSSGVIPFDDSNLGQGEVQGVTDQTLEGEAGSVAQVAETAETTSEIVEAVDEADATVRPVQPGVREGC